MKILTVQLSAADIASMPDSERALLLISTHAINEINTIVKLMLHSINSLSDENIVQNGQIMQTYLMVKLLAGKMYEAWLAINSAYFKTKLSLKYNKLLSETGAESLTALKKYFSDKSNIHTIRNEFSFHYSVENAKRIDLSSLSSEDFKIYLHEEQGNCLHLFSEAAITNSLVEKLNKGNATELVEVLMHELSQLVDHFNTFINELYVHIIESHYPNAFTPSVIEEHTIQSDATPHNIKIPFFVSFDSLPKSNKNA